MTSIEDNEHLNTFGENQVIANVSVHCWCAGHVAIFRIFEAADSELYLLAFTMAGEREVDWEGGFYHQHAKIEKNSSPSRIRRRFQAPIYKKEFSRN